MGVREKLPLILLVSLIVNYYVVNLGELLFKVSGKCGNEADFSLCP